MINHVYGLVGILGTLVTVISAYMTDKDMARWLLVCSGWLAAVMVLFALYFVNRGHENLRNRLNTVEDRNDVLLEKNIRLDNENMSLKTILAFLSKNPLSIAAIPKEQDSQPTAKSKGEDDV